MQRAHLSHRRIATNDGQTTFIKVQEYNDFDDKEEQAEVWEGLLHTLKETVGG